jgi:hypothetical protein
MKAVRFAVLGLAALFVAACLPVTTRNPVGSTAGFKPDPALIGLWKGHGEDEDKDDQDGYFYFLRNEDGSITAILITPGKDTDDWGTFTLETATLGPNHLMNVREGLKNGKPNDEELAKANIPMLYRIERDGTLTLALLDDEAAAAAVRAGKIPGTIEPGTSGDVHITAEPAAQDAFFATKEGAALFSKKLVTLTRVK